MMKDIVRTGAGVSGTAIKFAKPIIGRAEIEAVVESLGRQKLTNGANVAEFENLFAAYIGGGEAVAMSNCTAALYAAMVVLDIGPGREVIVPALGFAACAHVVEAVGAIPVFADCHPEAGQMDPEKVEPLINNRTAAIMLMHFAGRPGYLGTMKAIARRHQLPIIEDCATSLGATHSGKHVGLHGEIGCFSFHPAKHMTTAEGGMLVTTNTEYAAKARSIREFGRFTEVGAHSFDEYQIRGFGLNLRMTEMQGALGKVQIGTLNQRLEIRRSNYRKLSTAFRDMGLTVLDLNGESAAYCLIARMPENRSVRKVRRVLAQRQIETSVYYPGPLPMMPHYRGRYKPGTFPHAESIAQTTIAFSVGPHLGSADMAHTAETLREILQ